MKELTLTSDNFEQEVLKSDKPVLVDFWASWCGPCRMLAPVIEEIAEEADGFAVGKVNVDEQQELASAFAVQSIPTLVIIRDGVTKEVLVGLHTKEQIAQQFKQVRSLLDELDTQE